MKGTLREAAVPGFFPRGPSGGLTREDWKVSFSLEPKVSGARGEGIKINLLTRTVYLLG